MNTRIKNERAGDRDGWKLGMRGGDSVKAGAVKALTPCLAPRVAEPYLVPVTTEHCSLWRLTGERNGED